MNEIVLQKNTDWESLVSQGLELIEQKYRSQWGLGDLACLVVKRYGEDSFGQYAREIGIDRKSLYSYRHVAAMIPPELRKEYQYLSWTHFKIVSSLPNKEELLEKASNEEMSSERLAMTLKQNSPSGEYSPKPAVVQCSECTKFYLSGSGICEKGGLHVN